MQRADNEANVRGEAIVNDLRCANNKLGYGRRATTTDCQIAFEVESCEKETKKMDGGRKKRLRE